MCIAPSHLSLVCGLQVRMGAAAMDLLHQAQPGADARHELRLARRQQLDEEPQQRLGRVRPTTRASLPAAWLPHQQSHHRARHRSCVGAACVQCALSCRPATCERTSCSSQPTAWAQTRQPLRLGAWQSASRAADAGLPCLPQHSSRLCIARRFNFPTLDFDQFMSITKATSTTPYLVLNYDSANLIYGSGDWSYSQLLALAQSWLQYIIRMGYQVLCTGLSMGWRLPVLASPSLSAPSANAALCFGAALRSARLGMHLSVITQAVPCHCATHSFTERQLHARLGIEGVTRGGSSAYQQQICAHLMLHQT